MTTLPYVVRLQRTKDKIYQDCDVYIGSEWNLGGWNLSHSKWASPFTENADYEKYVKNNPQLLADLKELDGKVLGCWCRPEEQCHGQVLLKLFQESFPEAHLAPALVTKHHHPEGKVDVKDTKKKKKVSTTKRKRSPSGQSKPQITASPKKSRKKKTEDEDFVDDSPKSPKRGHTWQSVTQHIKHVLPSDLKEDEYCNKYYRNQDTHPDGIMHSKRMNAWPPLQLEDHEHTIWVDEAGQGSWAGPLHIGAVYILPGFNIKGIHDSKMLHEHERFVLYHQLIHSPHLIYHVQSVTREEIDNPRIGVAWQNGTRRAVEKVLEKLKEQQPQVKISKVVVDGSKTIKNCPLPVEAISKADSRFVGVGAAAILAKVSRDLLMEQLGDKPEYSTFKEIFQKGKGYAFSQQHRDLIEQGVYTDLHRQSFNPLKSYLEGKKSKKKHPSMELQKIDPSHMVDFS